jgi:hypothetical protein
MFWSAERRSMTGRWNTIACLRRGSAPLQAIVPELGARRPCMSRMSTLFPAPFGPRMMVLGPASSSSVTGSMIGRPATANDALSRRSGRIIPLIRISAARLP